MAENTGVENSGSVIYYDVDLDVDLPLIGVGKSICIMLAQLIGITA